MAPPRKPVSRRTKGLVGLAVLVLGWGAGFLIQSGTIPYWMDTRLGPQDQAAVQAAVTAWEDFEESVPPHIRSRLETLTSAAPAQHPITPAGSELLELDARLNWALQAERSESRAREVVERIAAWHAENPEATAGYVDRWERQIWPWVHGFENASQLQLSETLTAGSDYWLAAGRICLEYYGVDALLPGRCDVVIERLAAQGEAGREVFRRWLPTASEWLPGAIATTTLGYYYIVGTTIDNARYPVSPEETWDVLEDRLALFEKLARTDSLEGDWEGSWTGVLPDEEDRSALLAGWDQVLLRDLVEIRAALERLARVAEWLEEPEAAFPSMEVDERAIQRTLRGPTED